MESSLNDHGLTFMAAAAAKDDMPHKDYET